MSDLEAVTLKDPSSALTATFVPAAGMIGTSLSDGGVELLGQRRGLDAYVRDGKTMGIPILYPWANRLSDNVYRVDGTVVPLTAGTNGVRTDPHGAPIHGVLAAHPGWDVTERSASELTAELAFDTPELLAAFPFPHLLTQRVTLQRRTLTIETTVRPTTATAVPLCFGYHPYLRIPDVPRAQWTLTTPKMRHRPVDDHGLPTGEVDEWPGTIVALGDGEYDDGFDEVPAGALFSLSGGPRRIDVTFESGYPAAQLFAPSTDDVVGIEPMAAPTDALRRGGYHVAANESATATFSIGVS